MLVVLKLECIERKGLNGLKLISELEDEIHYLFTMGDHRSEIDKDYVVEIRKGWNPVIHSHVPTLDSNLEEYDFSSVSFGARSIRGINFGEEFHSVNILNRAVYLAFV